MSKLTIDQIIFGVHLNIEESAGESDPSLGVGDDVTILYQ